MSGKFLANIYPIASTAIVPKRDRIPHAPFFSCLILPPIPWTRRHHRYWFGLFLCCEDLHFTYGPKQFLLVGSKSLRCRCRGKTVPLHAAAHSRRIDLAVCSSPASR